MQAACKPDSVLDDHSSRRRVTAALQQPTRGFRLPARTPDLSAWAHRADTPAPLGECARRPCLFGLAPCGVYHAALIAGRPVRSYRTISPLPSGRLRVPPAVYFLLHWPYLCLEAQIPDVIRHTALRSPDFPPPPLREAAIVQPPAGGDYTGPRAFQGLKPRSSGFQFWSQNEMSLP